MSQKKKQNRAIRDKIERERLMPVKNEGLFTWLVAMLFKRKGEPNDSNFR